MSKLENEFEEDVDYFLKENKNRHCIILQNNNWNYKRLEEKLHEFIDKLLNDKSKDEKFKLEDEFFDCFYELMGIESMFLYKQGYKDCFKLWRMLDE